MTAFSRRAFLAALGASTTPLIAGCSSDGASSSPTEVTSGPEATGTPSEVTSRPETTGTPTATPTPEPPGTPVDCSSCEPAFLRAPPGFSIRPYANSEELGGGQFTPGPEPGPRLLESRGGTLYATLPSQGRVVALPPAGDGTRAGGVLTVLEDLERPHGIDFHDGHLYVATEHEIRRYRIDGIGVDGSTEEILVDDIPSGRYHWTRTIVVADGHIYLSAGSCNPPGAAVCASGNEQYLGAVTRFGLDGSKPTTYATGLRNAVGIVHYDGRLVATDNGVDELGPRTPPDEVNVLSEGSHYGFPECYGANVAIENETDGSSPCRGRAPPDATLPAHSAPLGLDVYTATPFPRGYRGQLYVALHGSWARPDPVGYKIVRIPYAGGSLGDPADFVTGWMPDDGENEDARGRPVDVHVADDGAMYVSDDLSGTIYRIVYDGE